jgi:PAS domain S-box-containing protein
MPDGTTPDAAAGEGVRPGASETTSLRAPRPAGPTLAMRLFALVAAVGFPLIAVAGWGVWAAQDAFRRQAEESLLDRVRGISLAVERDYDRAEALLQALAASSALLAGDLAGFDAEMRAASRAFGGLPVTLVGADGTILRSTLWPPGEVRPGTAAPQEALRIAAGSRSDVTDLFLAPLGEIQAVAVGLPLRGAAAPQGGIAPIGIGLSFPRIRIAGALRDAAGPEIAAGGTGWSASIVDRAGVSVARIPREGEAVGRPARPEMLQRLAGVEEGLLRGVTTRDGVPSIAAVTRGVRSGHAYILTLPLSGFTAPSVSALLRTALAGGAVVLVGFALAALLARRTVEAFRAARAAASGQDRMQATGLRDADELALALSAAASDRQRAEAALVASERRNREVLESLGERLYSLDRDGRVRFASRAALEGWGVQAADLLHRRFEEAFPAVAASTTWSETAAALRERREAHLCGLSPLLGRWVEVDAYPTGDGGLTVAFRDVEDLRRAHLDRARAAAALRASEQRLRLALDAAQLGAWELDLRAGTVHRSPRTLEIFGFGPEAEREPYPSWRGRMHPDDGEAAVATIQAALTGRIESYRIEYRHQRPDGAWIWVESHGRVVERDAATGAVLRIAGTSRDVTERRAAEERQALLAREVDHRAKNALAVVQAAVRLTPKEDASGFARAIEGRVNALARAQTLLAADRWTSADLRGLIEGELAPFLAAADRPAAVLSGPRVALPAGMAQPLAMAVHELATNAVKHGALSREGGQVLVSWSLLPDGAIPRLRLHWVERGGPSVSGSPDRRGFGSRVLEGTVRGQLRGEVTMHWLAGGLACEMELPLQGAADGAAAGRVAEAGA